MNKEEQEIRKKSPVQIRNKKASFEYFFVDTYMAGIVLTGTEIKSIRLGKASLVDAYCVIINGEMWLKGMNISPYFYGSYSNHESKRDRKLLLTRREISRLQEALKQVGYTIIPILVFIDEKGRAKVDIAWQKVRRCMTSDSHSRIRKTAARWTVHLRISNIVPSDTPRSY